MLGHHYRRFLLGFFLAAALVTVTAWILIFRGIYLVPVNRSAELVVFQKKKLEKAPPSEVILVGDSSLGNSIDAEQLSQLSGKKCLNLALNGAFGFEGSYEMAKWALDRHPVKKVVVMQTMDVGTRERQEEALIYVLHSPASLFTGNRAETWTNLSTLVSVFFSGRLLLECVEDIFAPKASPPLEFSADYVKQTQPITPQRARQEVLNGRVRMSRFVWLRRLKALCDERGIDLIYVHGPIFDDVAAGNPKLIASINDALRKTGIPSDFVTETMNASELGNSVDHVLPSQKDEFTAKYYRRLRTWLAQPAKVR